MHRLVKRAVSGLRSELATAADAFRRLSSRCPGLGFARQAVAQNVVTQATRATRPFDFADTAGALIQLRWHG